MSIKIHPLLFFNESIILSGTKDQNPYFGLYGLTNVGSKIEGSSIIIGKINQFITIIN